MHAALQAATHSLWVFIWQVLWSTNHLELGLLNLLFSILLTRACSFFIMLIVFHAPSVLGAADKMSACMSCVQGFALQQQFVICKCLAYVISLDTSLHHTSGSKHDRTPK